MNKIEYTPIGLIHSSFATPDVAPIQPAMSEGAEGTVDIFAEYAEGLADLDGFSHVVLLYHFHLSEGYSLKVKPFLDDTLRGVFATRAPHRPNSIGLSIVKLLRVEGTTLYIKNVDIVDNTPLLDIKPHVPDFARQRHARIGWLADKLWRP